MKTFSAKSYNLKKKWFLLDAKGQTLGRLSTKIVSYISGKYKPEYTSNINTGDYVIVINAKKVIVTGKKFDNKIYHHHTGYIGGLKKILFKDLLSKCPEKIIEKSIKGMLPKSSLGRRMYENLKVYAESSHPHQAQKPENLEI